MSTINKVKAVLLIVSVFLLIPGIAISAEEQPLTENVPVLGNADCVKCHPAVVDFINVSGEKHKTDTGCMDCHQKHPPMAPKEEAIPGCQICHEGTAHYALPECLSCHTNPHKPLQIAFGEGVTGPCLTCHGAQGEEMKEVPSRHAELGCSYCHTEHKLVPECTSCHAAHTEDMTNADCLSCHPAHRPNQITYKEDTPSKVCAACHSVAYEQLAAKRTLHSEKTCAFCHRDVHKVIPACETCHGAPHTAGIHSKFPKCADCHNTAHDLTK